MGERIKAKLNQFAKRNDLMPIAAIRGPGAMIGFEIVKHRGSFEPDADATKRLTTAALEKGLIVLSCGTFNNVIRILVPLTASEAIVDEGMKMLEQAMQVAH
jgi:4-aminobutyrate aminotransferase / (S)-3-amino-2-methylpropionate transaminase / 5-aminovalerate transaminase